MTAVRVDEVDLAPGVGAWFTGRATGAVMAPAVGVAGNLSHRRPHLPSQLARDRADAFGQMGVDAHDAHLMRQVHGRDVGTVTADTPPGAEIAGVDALISATPGRALAVQVADCVPVLLAAPGLVGAVHAGRRGVELGVIDAALEALAASGVSPAEVSAVVGPAIGGCCYEVPAALRDDVARSHPAAASETTWGTPSLDLPVAVTAVLEGRGVARTSRFGTCTRCDARRRWFSHRADPSTGRQLGVVVLGVPARTEVAA